MHIMEINILMPTITVFISGLFGLIVAIVTWHLANQREKRKFKQENLYKDYNEKVTLYISLLASIEKTIRITKTGKDDSELIEELSFNSAKINLIATEIINKKVTIISEKMYKWSAEYRQSIPSKISDTNYAIVSNESITHEKNANSIYPELTKEINELILDIKTELVKLKNEIEL